MIWERTPKDTRDWLEKALREGKISQDYYDAKMKELESELDEKASKNSEYHGYSAEQFRRIAWRPNQMDLTHYVLKPWHCADCGGLNRLDPSLVSLEGKGIRLLLQCSRCGRHSIVKVKGIFRPRLVTEARLSQEVNSQLRGRSTSFPTCKLCGKETSKTGNLTNMQLLGIGDPVGFNEEYGMMCADHAAELTKRIVSELGLSDSDLEKAMARATQDMLTDL